MSNYQIVTMKSDDDFFWAVSETQTEQIIDTFFFREDAEDYANFLIRGGGFDGFTPSFVLKSVKTHESLDESFLREFDDME